MCITWRGPSVPSPQIEAVGKFVSARTIRSAWPWILKLMDLTGQLFSRFSSCQITIDARTWRRSGERQGGTPFSTIFEFVRWSCRQSSSSGVYNGCCSTTIGNYDLSEYCLLANSNFPGHNFICNNVLLDAWKPPTDNLVYSTDPNVGVNILTYNSHTEIFELCLHASETLCTGGHDVYSRGSKRWLFCHYFGRNLTTVIFPTQVLDKSLGGLTGMAGI